MLTLIACTIAALVAYAIYKDAESRGMNGVVWFLATFFLMIVAVPIYLVVRKDRV